MIFKIGDEVVTDPKIKNQMRPLAAKMITQIIAFLGLVSLFIVYTIAYLLDIPQPYMGIMLAATFVAFLIVGTITNISIRTPKDK